MTCYGLLRSRYLGQFSDLAEEYSQEEPMRELCDLLEEVADSTAAVCARRTCGVVCVD